jgi:SAM-dependent methyltransferase
MSNIVSYSQCPVCGSEQIQRLLDVRDHSISKENFQIWQCGDCSLRFTQHIPDQQSIGRYYQSENYISHSDTKRGIISRLYHSVRNYTLVAKRKLINKVSGRMNGELLDVGCGTGAFINEMKRSGWNVTGVEPDAGARQKAKELYGIEPMKAEALFELPAKKYDVITLWHVMEHIHELQPYVTQLKNLLKDDGILIIAVPNYTSADARYYHYYWAAYDVPRHLYHFSPASMQKLMNIHGMEVKTEKPMWFDAFYVSMLSEQYKGSGMHILLGGLKGAYFNLQTVFNTRNCSSLIYLIRKKN